MWSKILYGTENIYKSFNSIKYNCKTNISMNNAPNKTASSYVEAQPSHQNTENQIPPLFLITQLSPRWQCPNTAQRNENKPIKQNTQEK